MRVAIGSDHAGFELREAVKTFLAADDHEIVDVGTHSLDPVDYPDYAQAVAAAVRESRAECGILLCGSGVGASMVANRIPGIRAGLCHDTYSAHQGVEHDDMNVLVLGGRVIGIELARELIRAFLNAHFALLFALETYERVVNAYISGLEKLVARGGDPKQVASVASFFISRIDTAVDALIGRRVHASTNARERAALKSLTGRVAIANAKLAYQCYEELFTGG